MNANEPIVTVRPPQLFPTLLKGFNTVAGKVYLILLPLLVDLFLWLGPKLRIYELLTPFITELSATMTRIAPKEMLEAVEATAALYSEFWRILTCSPRSEHCRLGFQACWPA